MAHDKPLHLPEGYYGPERTWYWDGMRWVRTGVTRQEAEANRDRRLGRTPEWREANQREIERLQAERDAKIAAERPPRKRIRRPSLTPAHPLSLVARRELSSEPGARRGGWMDDGIGCARTRHAPHLIEEPDDGYDPGELLDQALLGE